MANDQNPRTDLGTYLGEELKCARLAAGIDSQELLARELGFDRTVIVKAETGSTPPSGLVAPKIAERFPDLCNGLYVTLAEIARKTDGPIPGWFEDWLEAERQAHTLRYWQPIIIPGLFQTAEYARALLLAAQTDTSDEAIGALVAARLGRRGIFEKPEPPDVVVVLDEAVLRRLIGSPKIMYDQLSQLAELSTRPYVAVQVVPGENGANAGLGGALNIANVDGKPDVVHMDAVEGQTTERRALVRKATVAFERVRGDALSRGQSRDLILRLADELWNT